MLIARAIPLLCGKAQHRSSRLRTRKPSRLQSEDEVVELSPVSRFVISGCLRLAELSHVICSCRVHAIPWGMSALRSTLAAHSTAKHTQLRSPSMTMAYTMNIFHVLGDVSHTASKCILIWAIHRNRSAEGVSLLTQLLYMLVFSTRYVDIFWVPPGFMPWNFVLKIFYVVSSTYIVFLMTRVFARTREREYAWKLATWSLAGSLISAPLVTLILMHWYPMDMFEVSWTFSLILESVCILPQLLLLRQTSVPTVIDSFYLVTLGSYRFFYILNWLVEAIGNHSVHPTKTVFGIVQTALYIDFAWVYYSRQRVKLRGGGIVDSDDLSKSFLVKRFIGRRKNQQNGDFEDDDIADDDAALAGQENGVIQPNRSWGARGISVSADDTLHDHQAGADDAQMVDPSHFEDDIDDEADAPPPPAKDAPARVKSPADEVSDEIGSSAAEWQDNNGTAK